MSKQRVTQRSIAVTLLDDKEYFVRPLALSVYRKVMVQLQELGEIDENASVPPEMVDRMVDICYEALKPAHPDLKVEALADLIDIETAIEIINLAMASKKAE